MSNERSGLSLRANFSWTLVGNVVHAACWFAMTVVLAQLGSPADVGQFALGLATTAPIFMFAALRLREVQATDYKNEYLFGDYYALRLTTTALALLAVTVVALVSGFEREMALVIIATGASKAIEAISDAFYGLFMKHERLDRIAKSMIIKGPLSLVGLSLGFYLTDSVFWGVVCLAAARALILVTYDLPNAALSLNPATRLLGWFVPAEFPKPRWKWDVLASLSRLSLPLGFVSSLGSLMTNIPRYIIEATLGEYQLGIFAAIAAFKKVALTVVQALGRSAIPRMAKYYATENAKAFRRLGTKLVILTIGLGSVGVLVALVAGEWILTVFYGPEYALPGLFALIMAVAAVEYVVNMLVSVITSARYFRVQLPLQLITTVVIALACWWLIPAAGLPGAAMALAIGHLLRAGGTLLVARHARDRIA